jgi:hypothetical protein
MYALAEIYQWTRALMRPLGAELRFMDGETLDKLIQTGQQVEGLWLFQEGPDWEIGTNSINDGFQEVAIKLTGIWSIKADIDRADRIREKVRLVLSAVERASNPVTWLRLARREKVKVEQFAGYTIYSAIFHIELPM